MRLLSISNWKYAKLGEIKTTASLSYKTISAAVGLYSIIKTKYLRWEGEAKNVGFEVKGVKLGLETQLFCSVNHWFYLYIHLFALLCEDPLGYACFHAYCSCLHWCCFAHTCTASPAMTVTEQAGAYISSTVPENWKIKQPQSFLRYMPASKLLCRIICFYANKQQSIAILPEELTKKEQLLRYFSSWVTVLKSSWRKEDQGRFWSSKKESKS